MSDLIQTYYPELTELTTEQQQAARAALVGRLRLVYPDLDMSPNSVFGDLWVTPASQHLASLDLAQQRFKSDLNLENVAGGVIWDCDFVEAYLQNFGSNEAMTVPSYGTVRLVFNSPNALELDRKLVFADNQESVYNLRLAESGGLSILAPGTARTAGRNEVRLTPTNGTSWIVDIPVYGEFGNVLPVAGTAMELSFTLGGLVRSTALSDFSPGLPDNRLAEAAKRTRDVVYTATPSSKGGVRSMFVRQFPDAVGVVVQTNDDPDQWRVPTVDRAVDVYTRGRQTFQDQITIKAVLDEDEGDGVLWASLDTPSTPILIDLVEVAGQDITLDPASIKFYAQTLDAATAPDLSAGRSLKQKLWFSVDMPMDGVDPLIETTTGDDDKEYADFVIHYRQDPDWLAQAQFLSSDDNSPLGVDLLVRQPVVALLNSLTVRYRRRPGTTVKTTQAQTEIHAYVNSVVWPNIISEARIVDALFYAGASDVQDVVPDGEIQYGVATHNAVGKDPDSDFSAFYASPAIVRPPLSLFSDLKASYTAQSAQLVSASPQNIRYLVDLENIQLLEV